MINKKERENLVLALSNLCRENQHQASPYSRCNFPAISLIHALLQADFSARANLFVRILFGYNFVNAFCVGVQHSGDE